MGPKQRLGSGLSISEFPRDRSAVTSAFTECVPPTVGGRRGQALTCWTLWRPRWGGGIRHPGHHGGLRSRETVPRRPAPARLEAGPAHALCCCSGRHPIVRLGADSAWARIGAGRGPVGEGSRLVSPGKHLKMKPVRGFQVRRLLSDLRRRSPRGAKFVYSWRETISSF